MMADLRFVNVEKRYDETVIAEDMTFTIGDGEFFAILGPSRSGKSTILRMIAGLDGVNAGQIIINGQDKTYALPKDRDVAMFFQNLALYPHKNGFGNIAAPLKIAGVPRQEIAKRVQEVAILLGIGHLMKRRPSSYSGGERQRVAIARALVKRAGICLFDEPLSNLDAVVRLRLRSEFKRIQRELGATMVYVTPDQVEALAMADRIMVYGDGRVQQIGTPLEVYSNPKNVQVAGFVGSPPMNLLRGSLRDRDGSVEFRHDNGDSMRILQTGVRQWPIGKPVIFGVRPEDVRTVGRETTGQRVETIESVGRKKIVAIAYGRDTCKCLVDARRPVHLGENVALECDAGKVRLFSPEDGSSLEMSEPVSVGVGS